MRGVRRKLFFSRSHKGQGCTAHAAALCSLADRIFRQPQPKLRRPLVVARGLRLLSRWSLAETRGAERREAHLYVRAGEARCVSGDETLALRRSTCGVLSRRSPRATDPGPRFLGREHAVAGTRCPSPASSSQTGRSAGRAGLRGLPGVRLTRPGARAPRKPIAVSHFQLPRSAACSPAAASRPAPSSERHRLTPLGRARRSGICS